MSVVVQPHDVAPIERKDDDGSSWMELSFRDLDDSQSSFAAHSAIIISPLADEISASSVESRRKFRGIGRSMSMPLSSRDDKSNSTSTLSSTNSFGSRSRLKQRGVKKTNSMGGTRSNGVESTLARRRMLRRGSLSDSISCDSIDEESLLVDDISFNLKSSKSAMRGGMLKQISVKTGRYIGLKELAKKEEQSEDRRSLVASALYSCVDDDDDDYLESSFQRFVKM